MGNSRSRRVVQIRDKHVLNQGLKKSQKSEFRLMYRRDQRRGNLRPSDSVGNWDLQTRLELETSLQVIDLTLLWLTLSEFPVVRDFLSLLIARKILLKKSILALELIFF